MRAWDPAAVYVLLAVVLTVAALVSVTFDGAPREANVWAFGLAVLSSAPILVARQYPISAYTVSVTAVAIHFGFGFQDGTLPVASLFLLLSAGIWARPRWSAIALLYAGVIIAVLAFTVDRGDFPPYLTFLQFAFAWIGGLVFRSRREAAAAEVRAAEERAEIERQRASRRVTEERLRIAQELHDVVGHSMSVIAVQAGVGSHLIDAEPAKAKQALETISATSRSSLAEMRRLLGVLRGPDGAPTCGPSPSLADLPQLIDDVRGTGLPVSLRREGDPVLPNAAIELSAYRIVQEALTNVLRHSKEPTAVDVVLRSHGGALTVDIIDDGRATPPHGSTPRTGYGLLGMRERVEMWGGELVAGPVPDGGFRVQARLPYGAAS